MTTIGPSVLVRVLGRMHEAAKDYALARKWLDQIDLHENFYTKPVEHAEGKGFGSTEAARGSLSDWIVLKDGKIENYQVVTPTAWNVGPRDNTGAIGLPTPGEQPYVILGRPDAHSRHENRDGPASARSFRWPHAIAGSRAALYVADAGNHRVLGWAPLPDADRDADLVLGQQSFATAIEWPYTAQGPAAMRFPLLPCHAG